MVYMYMYINNMAIRDGISRPPKHAMIIITTGLSQFNVIIYYFTLFGKINCNFELPHARDVLFRQNHSSNPQLFAPIYITM